MNRVAGGRAGASLAELLVAVSILAVGGTGAGHLLVQASRALDRAELSLRAVLLLAELEGTGGMRGDLPAGGEGRPAGPGLLRWEVEGEGWVVRYEPPAGTGMPGSPAAPVGAGYLSPGEWRVP